MIPSFGFSAPWKSKLESQLVVALFILCRYRETYTVLSIILLSLQCILHLRCITHKCALTVSVVVLIVTAHVCGLSTLAPRLSADFTSVLIRGNFSLLLLACLTHRHEWHLYYCLALFIRYGAATERHFRHFDFLIYLFVLTSTSGIVTLLMYRLAFIITAHESFNGFRLLGFSETATTLGVVYCLNDRGNFTEIRLPRGYHLKFRNSFKRWLFFFGSDIRRTFDFPMGFLNPMLSGFLCWFLFDKLKWSQRRQLQAP